MVLYKVNQVFRYSPFRVDVSSAALPCYQSENSAESYSSGGQFRLESKPGKMGRLSQWPVLSCTEL